VVRMTEGKKVGRSVAGVRIGGGRGWGWVSGKEGRVRWMGEGILAVETGGGREVKNGGGGGEKGAWEGGW